MSFKKELEEILDAYKNYAVESITLQPTNVSEQKINKRQALTSIINLVDKELPEKKPNALKPGGIVLSEDGKTVAISNLQSASSGGYNQALTDMRNKLRDGE